MDIAVFILAKHLYFDNRQNTQKTVTKNETANRIFVEGVEKKKPPQSGGFDHFVSGRRRLRRRRGEERRSSGSAFSALRA